MHHGWSLGYHGRPQPTRAPALHDVFHRTEHASVSPFRTLRRKHVGFVEYHMQWFFPIS
jgi:hypothetical protein